MSSYLCVEVERPYGSLRFSAHSANEASETYQVAFAIGFGNGNTSVCLKAEEARQIAAVLINIAAAYEAEHCAEVAA